MKLEEVLDSQTLLTLTRYQLGFDQYLEGVDHAKLIELGVIKKDYINNKWIVDIFKEVETEVDTDELEEYTNQFRNKFAEYPHLKGNRGNKAKVYERLYWFMNETGLTLDEIDEATDAYIQECVELNRFLLDPHYFIWKAETSRKRTLIDSRLWSVYEDMQEDEYV